jgi:hypothetical protein
MDCDASFLYLLYFGLKEQGNCTLFSFFLKDPTLLSSCEGTTFPRGGVMLGNSIPYAVSYMNACKRIISDLLIICLSFYKHNTSQY